MSPQETVTENRGGPGAPEGATRAAEGAVEIDASPEGVWGALTEAAELERWFPLEARVEPGEGGKILLSWKNEYVGEADILTWEPPRLLRTSWGFSEESPQVTEYRIEAAGGKTRLRVVTSGFPADSSWDEWVEGTRRGWQFELRSLKHYLERHAGEDREVVYLRRRVPLEREDVWQRLFGAGGLDVAALGARPFDESPPSQYAALVDDPPGAMFRASTEPCHTDVDRRDVTLWLSAWGDHGERLAALESEWRELLTRLYPEGETL